MSSVPNQHKKLPNTNKIKGKTFLFLGYKRNAINAHMPSCVYFMPSIRALSKPENLEKKRAYERERQRKLREQKKLEANTKDQEKLDFSI